MSALIRCIKCGAMFGGLKPEYVAEAFRVHACSPSTARASHPSNSTPTPTGGAA